MALHTRVLRLVLSGLMGALLVVSKQAMSGLPNLEPVSLLIILFALELPRETPGAITVFILLQGVLYGFGLWWVMYLYVWYLLALLAPLAERFVTVTAHNPRAMPAQTLAEHIRAYGCTAEAADSIETGVARAEELGGEGPVCALGTLYFSGDVRQAFAKINKA